MNAVFFSLQASTKDVIAQDLIIHEAFFRQSKLLDQICDGLKQTLILSLMKAFPYQFVPLFTHTSSLTAEDVNDAIFITTDVELTPHDHLVLKFLRRYLSDCDQDGMLHYCIFSAYLYNYNVKVTYIT